MDHDERWRALRESAAGAAIGLEEQRRILHGHDPRLRLLLAANPAAHPAIQRELAELRWCWAPLGGNPALTVELQHRLATSRWSDKQCALLRHPGIDPGAQVLLAGSEHRDVRLGLAGYRWLVPKAALALAAMPDVAVRLGANPSLPPVLLTRFLHSENVAIRSAAARNPSVPPQRLTELADDRAAAVRRGVASNPALPGELVDRLLRDREEGVRKALLGNSAIGATAACRIADQRSCSGSLAAVMAGNPALPGQMQERYAVAGDSAVALRLAGNPALADAAAQVLRSHGEDPVRAALAGNPALPEDVMAMLLPDPSARVRAALAANPSLTQGHRRRMAADSDGHVLAALVARPDFDREELRELLLGLVGDDDPQSPRRAVLRGVPLWDGPTPADDAVLELPITGPAAAAVSPRGSLVLKACTHPDPLVRLAVLARAEIDPAFAAGALTDSDEAVARGARLAVLRRM